MAKAVKITGMMYGARCTPGPSPDRNSPGGDHLVKQVAQVEDDDEGRDGAQDEPLGHLRWCPFMSRYARMDRNEHQVRKWKRTRPSRELLLDRPLQRPDRRQVQAADPVGAARRAAARQRGSTRPGQAMCGRSTRPPVLSRELRDLAAVHLIARKQFPGVPPPASSTALPIRGCARSASCDRLPLGRPLG